jgi:hypothetical protein
MLKNYKMTFTKDRETFKTLVIPAKTLVDAYIEIQTRFPGVEITEAIESNIVTDSWAKSMARYLIVNASLDETCVFAMYLDEEKREELVNAIWEEWHKPQPNKAV